MPVFGNKIQGSSLFQRKLKTVFKNENIKIDWNADGILEQVESILENLENEVANTVKTDAQSMIKKRAYETGALYNSVHVEKSKYPYGGFLVIAGDKMVDYAVHVETGRFFAGKNISENPKDYTRVEAVPYLRQPLAQAKRKMRSKLIDKFRAHFK